MYSFGFCDVSELLKSSQKGSRCARDTISQKNQWGFSPFTWQIRVVFFLSQELRVCVRLKLCGLNNFLLAVVPLRSRHLIVKNNNWNTRTMCENYSKLTIKTPERIHWHHSDVFIVNIEQISLTVLILLLLTLNKYMPAR